MNAPARRDGRIAYRCRRCGAVDGSLHSPDVSMTVLCVVTGAKDPNASGISAHLIGSHLCDDGATGVTDLIGGVPYKEDERV